MTQNANTAIDSPTHGQSQSQTQTPAPQPVATQPANADVPKVEIAEKK